MRGNCGGPSNIGARCCALCPAIFGVLGGFGCTSDEFGGGESFVYGVEFEMVAGFLKVAQDFRIDLWRKTSDTGDVSVGEILNIRFIIPEYSR